MKYQVSDLPILEKRYGEVLRSLSEIQVQFVSLSQSENDPDVKEHLAQGVGMRLGVLRKCIQNVFEAFDLRASTPLSGENNNNIQINLHAFLINLVGVFDNCAWAYCYKHQLDSLLKNPQNIDFFKTSFRKFLPAELRDYIEGSQMQQWHQTYLKSYRDALAHRIPPRVPPLVVDSTQGQAYEALERERWAQILVLDFEGAARTRHAQEKYESPAFFFIHSFREGTKSTPVMLHAQMIADSITLKEFLGLFCGQWLLRS